MLVVIDRDEQRLGVEGRGGFHVATVRIAADFEGVRAD